MRLLTASGPRYRSLAAVTSPGKADYCQRRGMDFVAAVHKETRPSWEKIDHIREYLPGSDYLFFVACDAAITNPDIRAWDLVHGEETYDLIIAVDGNGLQSDVMIIRECQASIDFFAKVAGMEGRAVHEQDAMSFVMAGVDDPSRRDLIRTFNGGRRDGFHADGELRAIAREEFNRTPLRVKVLHQRKLNAFPAQYYGRVPDERYSWFPGDFICHMPALEVPDRVRNFKEILGL